MKHLFVSLILLASSSLARAGSDLTESTATHFHSSGSTQIVLKGAAADALFDDLAGRDEAKLGECSGRQVVVLKPFTCAREADKETFCMTDLFEHKKTFQAPDLCDPPNPSIIGVGTNPGIIKGKATENAR